MENTLLHGKWAPITFSVGFLETNIGSACDALIEWRKKIYSSIEVKTMKANLENAFLSFEGLINPPKQELLISTKSDWVAYFDNGMNGTDPFGPISYLSEIEHIRGLTITAVPHTLDDDYGKESGTYGSWQFELFSSNRRDFLNIERSIGLTYDGGRWVFVNEGEILDFEDQNAYRRRNVRSRFGFEILISYCKSLGLDINNSSFYGDDCCIISIKDTLKHETELVEIHEVQKKLGLK